VGEALFRAHFQHGRNLADPAVLVEAGVEGGLAAAQVQQLLESDQGLAPVQQALEQAQALGVSSVPTFVIDGRWAIAGAQSPQAFAQALQQIAAEQAADERTGAPGAGPTCTDDGCTP